MHAQDFVAPDSPILPCNQGYFPEDDWYDYKGSSGNANWQIGYAYGCVQYSKDLGGFNLNYNPSTRSAVTNPLNLGDGVHLSGIACNNCYAFFGAGFLAIVEYGSKSYGGTIAAEVKLGGGAGYNVDIVVNNPTLSGTSTLPTLVSGGQSLSIPIVSSVFGSMGLTVSIKGISAAISGTGAATGTFETGAGWSVTASAAAMYAGGSLAFPVVVQTSSVPPFYTSTSFATVKPFNALVTLTATVEIALGVSLGLFGFTFWSATFPYDR